MATDIFGANVNIKRDSGFKGDEAVITLSGVTDSGALVSKLQFTYKRPVNRIWDLTDGRVFLISGRSEGGWAVDRVVGPGSFMAALSAMTVCQPGTITVNGGKGFCGNARGTTYTLRGTVLSGLSAAVEAESMIMGESVEGIFVSLEVK